jgi:hypothetical protein
VRYKFRHQCVAVAIGCIHSLCWGVILFSEFCRAQYGASSRFAHVWLYRMKTTRRINDTMCLLYLKECPSFLVVLHRVMAAMLFVRQ